MKIIAHHPLVAGSLGALSLSVIAAVLALGTPAWADDDRDWLRLHEEVAAGEIKPLSDILKQLSEQYVGQVIDVDLEEDDGVRLYEIELLGPQGQVVEFEINAISGELLEIEGNNIEGMRR